MRNPLVVPLVLVAVACGGPELTPANVAPEPAGVLAVSFTRTFPPGFWTPGDHAYRLIVECPTQRVAPAVVRFLVDDEAQQQGTVFLRIDGPGRHVLSPSDLRSVHPDDTTVAVVTIAGMTESDAEAARTGCNATVVYDGLDPDSLDAGAPFSP